MENIFSVFIVTKTLLTMLHLLTRRAKTSVPTLTAVSQHLLVTAGAKQKTLVL